MFYNNSKIFLKSIYTAQINNINKAKSTIVLFKKILNRNFNTQVPAAQAAPPQKTKEQLKVEKLMENWPESVRNPQTEELKHLKETLEYTYKFHQGDKNYLKYHELPEAITRAINSEIYSCLSTENIARVFTEKHGFLTDEWIIKKFYDICTTHKDLDKNFYDIILPEVKKCIANSDRQCNNILTLAVIGGANAFIGDREFWGLLEHKLVNERLYRYLTLEQQISVAHSLSIGGHKWTTLLKALEVNFIKHRKAIALNQESVELVRFAYKYNEIGTELLFKALEDPTIEVPGIDAKIPLMNKGNDVAEIGYENQHKRIESKVNH